MAITLTAAVTPGDSLLYVDTAPPSDERPFSAEIDGEQILVDAATSTVWGPVHRGVNGTSKAAHAQGAVVTPLYEVAFVAPNSSAGAFGSAASPIDLPANANLLGAWANAKATGDHRTIYARLYAAFAGASGEAMRAYATVVTGITAAIGGTLNGLHASLKIAGTGKISGAGQAVRATLEADANAVPGGTLAVIRADSNLGAGATIPDTVPFLALDNLSTVKIGTLLALSHTDTSKLYPAAGTAGGSAGNSTHCAAQKVLRITVDGADAYIPVFTQNS